MFIIAMNNMIKDKSCCILAKKTLNYPGLFKIAPVHRDKKFTRYKKFLDKTRDRERDPNRNNDSLEGWEIS